MNELTRTNNPNEQLPLTKVQMVEKYAKQIANGDETIFGVGRELGLNKNQISFVEIYMSEEYKGSNGRDAAATAYGYDLTTPNGKRQADNMANKLLKHSGVLTLITVLHDNLGFNDEWVDRQLKIIIDQNVDWKAKLMGINEYNKLKMRLKTITEIQVKPTFDFATFTREELKQFIELTTKAKIRHDQTQHLPLLNDNNERIG